MKNNIEKIIESAKEFRLTGGEKSQIKANILRIVESTPVKSPYSFVFVQKYALSFVALLLFVGVGTSLAAQSSLPGETLYPIKINVNENLESFLTFSEEQELNVDIKQASRRLDEVQGLASKGKFSAEIQVEIEDNFTRKSNSIDSKVSEIEKRGDTEKAKSVRNKFEVEIEDHITVLENSNRASSTRGVSDMIKFVRDRRGKGKSEDKDESKSTSVNVQKMESGEKEEEDDSRSSSKIEIRHEENEFEDEDEGDDDNGGNSSTVTPVNPAPAPTPTPTPTPTPAVTTYTMVQVSAHNTKTNCWSVVSGGVYNLTSWIAQHPGGQSAIIGLCGIDGTSAFLAQHGGQGNPAQELASFKIGVLK